MSEAVYLRKPMLSVPVERQFEQVLNALYLQQLGYGGYARRHHRRGPRARSSSGIPEHAQALAGYTQDGNTVALAALHEQLARFAARRTRRGRAEPSGGT